MAPCEAHGAKREAQVPVHVQDRVSALWLLMCTSSRAVTVIWDLFLLPGAAKDGVRATSARHRFLFTATSARHRFLLTDGTLFLPTWSFTFRTGFLPLRPLVCTRLLILSGSPGAAKESGSSRAPAQTAPAWGSRP